MENPQSNFHRDELLFRGKFLEIYRDAHWEYASRVNGQGAVMVIPITLHGELILVEEYRYPLHQNTIGLPAGICGDEANHQDEPVHAAAARELEEETGYRAQNWKYLFTGPSSPGLTSEVVSFYLASGLKKVSQGGGIDHEDIKVHCIPLDQVHDWALGQIREGKAVDPRVFMALYFASLD